MPVRPPARSLGDRFDRRALRFERLASEATNLRRRQLITAGSADSIHESAFINLVTSFETFLEELFYSVLLDYSGIPGSNGAVKFARRAQAELILADGRPYIDWLPFDRTVERGRRLLIGSPFDRLNRQHERAHLNELAVVRNAIAHDSGSAKEKFKPLAAHLRPGRRTPAGLLQSTVQGDSMYVVYSTRVRTIARALSAQSVRDAKSFLGPEAPYLEGDSPAAGKYACFVCTSENQVSRRAPTLPRCMTCVARGSGAKVKSKWVRMY